MIDNAAIDFYGADWCGDCHRAKAALDRFGVAYSLHDIEHEDGAAEKAIAISGQQHIPVIRFADGSWLVEPSATHCLHVIAFFGKFLLGFGNGCRTYGKPSINRLSRENQRRE